MMEEIDHQLDIIRSFRDDKLITSFRMFNVGIADMDRQELLGVICWLIRNAKTMVTFEEKNNG